METIAADGTVRPGSGTLTVYEAPSGPGVRTDGFGYAGYRTIDGVRLAAGQGHRPFAVAGLRGRRRRAPRGR